MRATLGTNDLVPKAECNRKGWQRRGGMEAGTIGLFPHSAGIPGWSLVSKMGPGKAGCAAMARAEPKLWAQVFPPTFLDLLIGASCAPSPAHRRAARALPSLLGWEALLLPGTSGVPRLGFEAAGFQ